MLGISLPYPSLPSRLLAAGLGLLAAMIAPGQVQALCFNTGPFLAQTLCWNPVNPIPDAYDIERVVWNPQDGEFLAVGGGGAILTSPDGIDWTPRASGTIQRLFGGVWDGQRYVVVGDGGLVLTSPDGIDWTSQTTNNRARLLAIAVNADRSLYVAVGERGTVLSSPDATIWTETTVLSLSRRPALYGILWHNNRFVAVGSSTTIISSTNGTDWIEHNYTPLTLGQPLPPILRDVAVNSGGLYVAVGTSATVYTSSNGTEWDPSPLIEAHPNARLRSVVWTSVTGVNRFLAVGDNGTLDEPLVLESQTNGIQWSMTGPLPPEVSETLKTITFTGTDVATGGNRTLMRAAASTLDWEPATVDPTMTPTLNAMVHAPFANPLHLAAGEGGAVLSSADGLSWERVAAGVTDEALNGLAIRIGDGGVATRAVTVGDSGTILYSDDGAVWQTANVTPPISANLAAVAHGDDLFVAVGAGGTILNSQNGEDWAIVEADFGMDLHGITYALMTGNSSLFVAVGAGGAVLTSENGSNWLSQDSGAQGTLNAVLWNADEFDPLFVAVGQTTGATPVAAAIYSTNGTAWSDATLPVAQPSATPPIPPVSPLRGVAWNGRQFIAASDRGVFLRSPTGRGWTAIGALPRRDDGTLIPLPRMNAVAWTGSRFLAAGEDGRIVSSGGVDVAVGIDTDLSVTEEDDPFFARAGLEKRFRFTVANIGILDATNVQFIYQLPPQVPNMIPPTEPDNTWNCSLNGNAGVSCNTGRLVAGTGDAVVIELEMTMPDSGDSITHNVEVPAVAIGDTQPGNNTLAVVTRLGPRTTPGLPSPDTDFSSRGAFGSFDMPSLVLLTLLAGFFHLLAARRPRDTAVPHP